MSAQQLDHKEEPAFKFPSDAFDRTHPKTYTCPNLPPFDVPDKPPQHSIRSINWNPFGNLVATGAADKTLRVCKLDAPPPPTLTTVSFSHGFK